MKGSQSEEERQTETVMIVEGINFGYNKSKPIIEDVNLSVSPGDIIGISGENGSGKSTLLKILVGLLSPQSGTIKVKNRIGYSPQNLLLFNNLTSKENFQVFGKGMGLTDEEINSQSYKIMKKLNFIQFKNTIIKNLSGGTRQKVNFGISLLGDPEILVLDEPYQGMDYASFTAFWDIQFEMRQMGKAIIIVSHIIEDQSKFTKSLHLINKRLQSCAHKACPLGCEGD